MLPKLRWLYSTLIKSVGNTAKVGGGGGAGKRIFKEMFIVTGKDSEVLDLEAIMF